MTTEEVRAWAKRCADVTRGRMAEGEAWELIAERGEEWQVARNRDGSPYRGGPMMRKQQCFNNAARTALGLTAFDAEGCRYAEGFALSAVTGMWVHHAWVLNAFGLVIDRTWEVPGERYVGVTFDDDQAARPWGMCQLASFPLDMPWGPYMEGRPEDAAALFARNT
jgi:hypothetical protein